MTGDAGAWLFELALKSMPILGLAWALTALAGRLAAAERHLVWALALLGCIALPALAVVAPPLEAPFAFAAAERPAASRGSDAAAPRPVPGLNQAGAASGERTPPAEPGHAGPSLVTAAVGLYAFVAMALLVRFAGAAFAVSRRAARLPPAGDARTLALVGTARRRLGIRRPVRTLMAQGEQTPWVLGVLFPAIVLPDDFPAWNEDERLAAVTHELAHIARFDQITLWIGHLACALLWFQPLAWFALKRMAREAERACDDCVLLAGVGRAGYAKQLVNIADRILSAPAGGLTVTAMARSSAVGERVRSILNPTLRRNDMTRFKTVLMFVAAAVVVTPVAVLKSQDAGRSAGEAALVGRVEAELAGGRRDAAVAAFVEWIVPEDGTAARRCDYCARLLRERGPAEAASARAALLDAFDEIEQRAVASANGAWLVRLAGIALASEDSNVLDLGKHYLYEAKSIGNDGDTARWMGMRYLIEMGRLAEADALIEQLRSDPDLTAEQVQALERWSTFVAGERTRNDAITGRLFVGSVEPVGEEEFIPLYKVMPVYPAAAAEAGLEGDTVVEFTVSELGRVEDAFVVTSTAPIFDQASLAAATRFRYIPRTVDGEPVAVSGVRNRINFRLTAD